MRIPIYQIDAFTSQVFEGNPAAVCLLDSWLEDRVLQSIAAENNLSETAFIVRQSKQYDIRWFTPAIEIDLCGHATLASAYVIFHYLQPDLTSIKFSSRSGQLDVSKRADQICLDFPSMEPSSCTPPNLLLNALGMKPKEVLSSRDYLVVYDSEEEIRSLTPNFVMLKELDRLGVIVTSPGKTSDFVSRFFAPKAGISEDPVTGSAHCTLIPYWARRLGKNSLHARQISARGGELFCDFRGERVLIAGQAALYLEGWIHIGT